MKKIIIFCLWLLPFFAFAGENQLQSISISKAARNILQVGINSKFGSASQIQAPVIVFEFFDYNCPYCRAEDEVLRRKISQLSGVALYYIDYTPLGDSSLPAVSAALAARNQGKYLEMHQALMRYSGELDDRAIEAIAKKLGLNRDQFNKDKNSAVIQEEIEENATLASAVGVDMVPTLVMLNAHQLESQVDNIPAQKWSGPITPRFIKAIQALYTN